MKKISHPCRRQKIKIQTAASSAIWEMEAVNADGKVINITEGRFDTGH